METNELSFISCFKENFGMKMTIQWAIKCLSYLKQRFFIAIQSGNAAGILEKIISADALQSDYAFLLLIGEKKCWNHPFFRCRDFDGSLHFELNVTSWMKYRGHSYSGCCKVHPYQNQSLIFLQLSFFVIVNFVKLCYLIILFYFF